jgi:3-oxoadipate enol-lactonase
LEDEMQVFTYKGCPIHYQMVGPEGAPLVVLTHGGMVDHCIWEPQMPALSPRYRVLLWDVRGHGRSRPGGKSRSIPDVAEDLAALLDHLGQQRAVLVGLSAGGWLVQEFAYRYPDRAIALVVAGQSSWMRPPLQVRMMVSRWSVLFLIFSFLLPWRLLIRMFMHQGAAHAKPRTLAYLRQAFGQWSKAEFLYHSWHARGLGHEPAYRFQQPLLIVHGEHEMGFVRKDAAAWAKREPRSRYVVIPDAGHVANMDNPKAFNAALLEFLAARE